MAPVAVQSRVVDHLTHQADPKSVPRQVLTEAARITRGKIRDLSTVLETEVDGLIIPGGEGVVTILSDYASKGVICEVHPDLIRLMKGLLRRHRPMGFVCIAPILAARILGPAAGVRITLGSKTSEEAKHAAVMGADVRPCAVREIIVDEKNRVVSTPAYMCEEVHLLDVGIAIDRLVRTVVTMARNRREQPLPKLSPKPTSRPEHPSGVILRKARLPTNRGVATRPADGSS
jgi:enhancing lycopene biosynthesis protein 2